MVALKNQPDPNADVYRLETEKKIYMIRHNPETETYDIIQGTKTGVCTTERHSVIDGTKGRTAVQEATLQVANLLKAKMKSGFKMVKGEIEKLDDLVAKVNIVNVELGKAEKVYNKAKAALEKIQPKYDAAKEAYDEAEKAYKELKAKAGIEEPAAEQKPAVA